jgi:hypothetical protein
LSRQSYSTEEAYQKSKQRDKEVYYKSTQKYPMHPWTKEEEMMVLNHDITDMELSSLICRSVGAIQTKRWELNCSIQ